MQRVLRTARHLTTMASETALMTAVRFHAVGGPDVLRVEQVPRPAPGAGEVQFRVEVAGVNYIETYQREGLYKVELPAIPGAEGAGVVTALGAGVSGVAVGDRIVTTAARGTYAQYSVCPAARAVKVPAGVRADEAAAGLLQGMTAHYLTRSTFELKAGHTCLVHAAAGGTGLLLVQQAKMAGARVIGTVSTEHKAALARAAGADEVILYSQVPDFDAEVRRLTDGRGVDVVYDSVGKDTFDRSVKSLRPRGMLVMFGQSSGVVPPFDLLRLSPASLFLTRPVLHAYTADQREFDWRSGEVLQWVAEKKLKVTIGLQLPLAQAADAHVALQSRKTTGKVLLLPPQSI